MQEIKTFREFFPEFCDHKLIGIIATLNVSEEQLRYAERRGFLVLGIGEEIMEVKNREGFRPKEW